MIKSFLLLALVFLPAFASEIEVDPCNAKDGAVTSRYLCVEQKMMVVDKALNRSYQKHWVE